MFNPDVVKKCSRTAKESYRMGKRKSAFLDSTTKTKAEEGSRQFWKSDRSLGLKERLRKRMAKDNPMYDLAVAARVGMTRTLRINDGSITFPKGKDHWLWTGKRPFNLFVRTRLYKRWILPIMERDHFACTKCGRSKCVLHVHHLVSLDSIIATVLRENDILDIEAERCSNRYSEIADAVVARHDLSQGITVCKRCHAKIDERYRGYEKAS
jgi:5-methylcytosine-specific restriction endonuclease McrA